MTNLRGRGIKEFRTHFRNQHLFIEVVKEEKSGLVGRMFGMKSMRGVGKVARLEFLGPNRGEFLIYRSDTNKYRPHSNLSEGTIEDCVDAIFSIFF